MKELDKKLRHQRKAVRNYVNTNVKKLRTRRPTKELRHQWKEECQKLDTSARNHLEIRHQQKVKVGKNKLVGGVSQELDTSENTLRIRQQWKEVRNQIPVKRGQEFDTSVNLGMRHQEKKEVMN